MANKFEETLAQLIEDGNLDEEGAEILRKTSEGSPLRQQLKAAQDEAEQLKTRNQTLETKVMTTTFKEAGFKIDPGDLKLPEDLDVTDAEAVKAWGIEKGFVDKPQSTTDEELAGHEAIAEAGAGQASPAAGKITVDKVAGWSMEERVRFAQANPDAWEALKRGEDVVLGSVA